MGKGKPDEIQQNDSMIFRKQQRRKLEINLYGPFYPDIYKVNTRDDITRYGGKSLNVAQAKSFRQIGGLMTKRVEMS